MTDAIVDPRTMMIYVIKIQRNSSGLGKGRKGNNLTHAQDATD